MSVSQTFTELLTDVKSVLVEQYDASRIDNIGYAQILTAAITNAQSLAVELELQKPLNAQQIAESVARAQNDNVKTTATVALTNRQETALDDAKKVKKAELLGNTVSLIESGGSTAPAQSWTDFNTAVAAI